MNLHSVAPKSSSDDLARWHARGYAGSFFFDESSFSPNPPITYGWARRGQTHAIEPQPTRQDDVIAFFDQLSTQVGTPPHIVVLDNAGIHRSKIVERCRRRWARQGLGLFFLPPYSPELNRIEILWKHAKHF